MQLHNSSSCDAIPRYYATQLQDWGKKRGYTEPGLMLFPIYMHLPFLNGKEQLAAILGMFLVFKTSEIDLCVFVHRHTQ